MPSLDALLARRNARRIETAGDPARAEARRDLSLLLWRSWAAFDPLRRHLDSQRPHDPERRGHRPFHAVQPAQHLLVEHLTVGGYIRPQRPGFWRMTDDPDRQIYLRGGWLEELGFLAIVASGADEAVFAQKIEWQVGPLGGTNEIDVLARKGDVMSVMSCKTATPVYEPENQGLRDKFRQFLFEADYWDQHFADGQGRAVLLVTTDLFDERAGSWRCPTLAGRAQVLNADLIGTDHDRWGSLVDALRRHWA